MPVMPCTCPRRARVMAMANEMSGRVGVARLVTPPSPKRCLLDGGWLRCRGLTALP